MRAAPLLIGLLGFSLGCSPAANSVSKISKSPAGDTLVRTNPDSALNIAPSALPSSIPSYTPHPTCDPHFFDRDQLLAKAASGEAKSITGLIQDAPDCFRLNQVSIYKPQGVQCGTKKAPRMVLYINDALQGNTVCTFNSGDKSDYSEIYATGLTSDCHENSLECQSFNTISNRFEFFEVLEQNPGTTTSKLAVSEINPTQCMECHRGKTPFAGQPDPRPNLEDYPAWPGFYGSMHDKFGASAIEKDAYFNTFLPYKRVNSRYAALPDIVTAEGNYPPANSKPAVNLQNVLSAQNYHRVAAQFTDPAVLGRIWPFRYAILGALACNDQIRTSDNQGNRIPPQNKYTMDTFIPTNLSAHLSASNDEFNQLVLTEHLENLKRLYSQEKELAPDFKFDQFETQYARDLVNDPSQPYSKWDLDAQDDFWNVARLGFLAKNLGLPSEDWSMTVHPTYDFEAGAKNPKQILKLIYPWLLDTQKDPDIQLSLDSYLGMPIDPVQCEKLRTKSLEALSGPEAIAALDATSPQNSTPNPNPNAPPTSLGSCIQCHVIDRSGPFAPYDQPEILKDALLKPSISDPSKNLLEMINQRIDSGSMPPNGRLNPAQREDLKNFFVRKSLGN